MSIADATPAPLPPAYAAALAAMRVRPRHWLVTGVAGFIGSHLLETLLRTGQRVTGLDNFATGHWHNLMQVKAAVDAAAWDKFSFLEADIRDPDACRRACAGVDIILHQAALGSVPRSLADPLTTNAVNLGGFLAMLVAAKDAGVQRFVYAASSSTYGDHPGLPKVEDVIGQPLSPYAVTKYANELYAEVFGRCHGLATVGLRYFNVFGPRQDPHGAYAAVIPKWAATLLAGEAVLINGDGETSRDFCYVDNAVQANILAAVTDDPDAMGQVYNVAVGERTTLNSLHELMAHCIAEALPGTKPPSPSYRDFRAGDVRHSLADIGKARSRLGYQPTHRVAEGVEIACRWFAQQAGGGRAASQADIEGAPLASPFANPINPTHT